MTVEKEKQCELCESKISISGPLWIGKIFNKEFVENMLNETPKFKVSKNCEKTLCKCIEESEMPGAYFTLDEIASKMKTSPPKLEKSNIRITEERICL